MVIRIFLLLPRFSSFCPQQSARGLTQAVHSIASQDVCMSRPTWIRTSLYDALMFARLSPLSSQVPSNRRLLLYRLTRVFWTCLAWRDMDRLPVGSDTARPVCYAKTGWNGLHVIPLLTCITRCRNPRGLHHTRLCM